MLDQQSHLLELDPGDPNFRRRHVAQAFAIQGEIRETIARTRATIASTRALMAEADRVLAQR